MAEIKKRGPPLFALVLVAAGVVLLLQNLGAVSWELWLTIWRFWPALLIAIGVKLMLGRRMPWLTAAVAAALLTGSIIGAAILAESDGRVSVERISEPLGETRVLDLWVAFGAGSLTIDSLPRGSSNLVEGSFRSQCSGPEVWFQRNGDVANLNIEREDLDFEMDGGGLLLFCPRGVDWRVSLSPVPEIIVDLGLAAASIDLDLAALRVTSLYVDGGAASLDITMPANAGDVEAVISASAASIDVRIPDGVEARIINQTNLSSLDVVSRFHRLAGGLYQSPGYHEAENRVQLELLGGASSVRVR